MLIRRHDEASREAGLAILREHDFGQFVFPGSGATMPAIVPSHFVLVGEDRVLAHFTSDNPLWARVAESPRVALAVIAGYTYVPSAWNASSAEGAEYGVPTSYYAAAQAEGTCRVIDAPGEMAQLLNVMLDRFEPQPTRRHRVEPGDNPDARQFGAIRGLEMRIERLRAKTKFGGNRTPEHRAKVRRLLLERGEPQDVLAARFMGEP